MKKSILNIGDSLSKTEQKQITGGNCGCPTPRNESECLAIGGFWSSFNEKCLYPSCYC